MVLVAQIIVDVPLMQTDRPYSYLIPEAMQGQIAIGMRVHVPFGKGNRLLQGFVIGLEEQENLRDFPELKPIAELLDYEPVLNQDQLDLADQMRHTVFSYKISILKSMLPGLLNSQYDKVIMATDKLDEEDFIDDAYIMEVSSPGLGRPLKKEKDYVRSMGKEIEIRTYRAINREKEFYGILSAYDESTVTIETENGEKMTFEKPDIALIRLAFDF